jgi:signal transduction histidine kinase
MADSVDETIVDTLRLEVHPSVVFKLGADLITDDMQALSELVKNSYDADGTRVRVVIDTNVLTDAVTGEVISEDSREQSDETPRETLRGSITIEDDGIGMNLDAIRRGWLTVSLSHKQEMKARGETTAKKRTPLGDKGLGRLGAQRLGDVLTLTTRTRDVAEESPPLKVSMIWSRFAAADSLNAVPIEVHRLPPGTLKPGTTLEIRGLRDPEFWKQNETNDLQRELAAMISPYEGVAGFRMTLAIDDKSINLRETAQSILAAAPISYSFNFDGRDLSIEGRFTAEVLRPPQGRADIATFDELIGFDNGYAFTEWLLNEKAKNGKALGVQLGDDKHFLTSTFSQKLEELSKVEMAGKAPVNPGAFHGEVSGIPLTRDTTSVFDKASDYREFVKALVGIKVYRDGFGVRVDDDWLGLGAKWTSGASYYSLRPGNVTGYVSISAKENAALEETTNREAFRDTPAYRNFYRLLTAWADYTGRVQEYLRRSYNEYRAERLGQAANIEPRATPEDLIRKATSQIDETSRLARQTANASSSIQQIQKATEDLERQKEVSESTVFQDPALTNALDQTISRVRHAASEAEDLIRNLDGLLNEQESLKQGVELLAQQLDLAQEQISDAWESVALGLSAETLAHEVQHISDGLRARSAQITTYLNSINHKDQRVWTFVEHVRSSSGALSKQVSRLTPSLRYMRERRDDIAMSDEIETLRRYYLERWGANRLRMETNIVNDFSIRANSGKLTQVLDNLVLNSEYWLLQGLATKTIDEGVITVTVDEPHITVEDNGIGFDESIEELAFEPFITMKPAQQGRGLGLFVVRQLLDSMDASIALAPDRNAQGRRSRLRLSFARALSSTRDA